MDSQKWFEKKREQLRQLGRHPVPGTKTKPTMDSTSNTKVKAMDRGQLLVMMSNKENIARGYIPPTGAQYFREKIYQSIWVEVLLMYGNPSTPDGNPSILMEDLPDVWKSIHPGWKSIHTRHTRWKSIHPRWKSIHSIRAKRRNPCMLEADMR